MSGPKVVNIEALRRQQKRECNALLRELSAAVEECLCMRESDASRSTDFKQETRATLNRLNALQEAEQWQELLMQTSAHRDFYRSEAENLRQQRIERRSAELRREHRLRQAAAQMISQLGAVPACAVRDDTVRRLSASQSVTALAKAIDDAEEILGKHSSETADATAERIRELAAGYAPAFNITVESSPKTERDPDEVRLERCWELLGQLDALTDTPIASWKENVDRAAACSGTERALLLDSLALELTSFLRQQRARQTAREALQSVLADLAQVSTVTPEGEAWRNRLKAALLPPTSPEDALALARSARVWVEAEIRREDVREQRSAVLRALAALGYEVREGMATAWTEQGRVVVLKPNESVYAIELTAPQTGAAVQVRVVAAGSQGRTKQRDFEVEQAWCSEFARLRSMLSANGFSSALAVANSPGTVPLKEISNYASTGEPRKVEPRQSYRKSEG